MARRRPMLVLLFMLFVVLLISTLVTHPSEASGLDPTSKTGSRTGLRFSYPSSYPVANALQRVFYHDFQAKEDDHEFDSKRCAPAVTAPPVKPSPPGFGDSLANCRVADLPNDPLVKEYGQNNIRLSRAYEGTGDRVRRVLQKARSGQKIKIAVVGGSVSTGHGVKPPFTSKNYMYYIIHQWFLDTFPGAEHEINLDSAIPATTAFWFSYCVLETVPEDADLILMELDINHHEPSQLSFEGTEALYRTLLDMPNQPAVIYMSVFALIFNDMTHGWRQTTPLNQWFDVPQITIRNFLLPHLMRHTDQVGTFFLNWADDLDTRHMNVHGHRAMGDMVVAYLREQFCMLQRDGPVEQLPENRIWPGQDIVGVMPRLGLLDQWSETKTVPHLRPFCKSITSVRDPLKPVKAVGWEAVSHNDKKSFEATDAGSEVTFAFHVDTGLVGFMYWRTKDPAFGDVICWVDDDTRIERLRRIEAHWPDWQASTFEHTAEMWDDISPGQHTITCRSEKGKAGGTLFRIQAVVTR